MKPDECLRYVTIGKRRLVSVLFDHSYRFAKSKTCFTIVYLASVGRRHLDILTPAGSYSFTPITHVQRQWFWEMCQLWRPQNNYRLDHCPDLHNNIQTRFVYASKAFIFDISPMIPVGAHAYSETWRSKSSTFVLVSSTTFFSPTLFQRAFNTCPCLLGNICFWLVNTFLPYLTFLLRWTQALIAMLMCCYRALEWEPLDHTPLLDLLDHPYQIWICRQDHQT